METVKNCGSFGMVDLIQCNLIDSTAFNLILRPYLIIPEKLVTGQSGISH